MGKGLHYFRFQCSEMVRFALLKARVSHLACLDCEWVDWSRAVHRYFLRDYYLKLFAAHDVEDGLH